MENETEIFLKLQRGKMLRRLEAQDIPAGVLAKVMKTWMEIENHCADMLEVRSRKDG